MAENEQKSGAQIKVIIANAGKADTDLIRKALSDSGYYVIYNEGADVEVSEIEAEAPALLILGMRPNDKPGTQLLEKIDAKGLGIPILVVTTPELATDNLSQKGIAGILMKPLDTARLLEHVKSVIGLQQITQGDEPSPTGVKPARGGPTAPSEGEAAAIFRERKSRGENPIVLVVDDEPDMQTLLTDLLGFSGFQVLTASDGVEGLQLAQEKMPNAILLDIMLPKLDGYQVCRLLKYNEKFRGIPVIMLSARDHPKDKELADGSGANGYITKPFETDVLVATVKQATAI